jgi:hypothetical protein
MICGREPPFDFQITRERDKEADPDRKELEIHIKRNHSLEEMQRHLNPGQRRKAKAGEQEQGQQEQEGEEAIKTDDIVAELFKKEGLSSSTAGARSSRGRSRSTSRSRKTRTTEPDVVGVMVGKTEDASSADL